MKLAISGRMAAGKSHVRQCIEKKGFKPVSLATPLKQLAEYAKSNDPHAVLDLLEDMTEDYYYASQMYAEWFQLAYKWIEVLETDMKPRHFLQELGSCMRAHPNYDTIFIDYMLRGCGDGDYVCDDLRYKNEAHAFKEYGWYLIRCDCPEELRKDRCLKLYGKFGEEQNHPSEIDLNDWTEWDYVLDTSVPMDKQEGLVDIMLETLYSESKP